MSFGISFFATNCLLGVGLAMDAFSVSLANGLNEPAQAVWHCGYVCIFSSAHAHDGLDLRAYHFAVFSGV